MLQQVQPPPHPLAIASLQRAHGLGRIAVKTDDDGATRLARLYQDGCAKIRLPRDPAARGLEAVMLNTAGGLTGGDRLAWRADVPAGARLTLTTQACEKIYRAGEGRAEVDVELRVADSGRADWIPQETILFDGGALSRRLDVLLSGAARLLLVEAVVLGRTAMGETVRTGALRDRWRVRRDGRLLFADDLALEGAIERVAAGPATLAGDRAFAALLYVGPEPETRLGGLRAILGPRGGASAFDGKLFARVTAPDGLALRRVLAPALELLRDGEPCPRVWRL